MLKLPDLDTRIDNIYDIINGRTKTQLLMTSIELKIFDHLENSQSSRAVAARLNTNPMYTRFLLDGLTALHLLDKKEGCYRNRSNTQAVLHSQSPAYQGEMFSMMEQMSATVLADMGHTVRSGPREKPGSLGDESVWQAYARAMANHERGGAAQNLAAVIAQIDGFASFEKMLDLGGGPGLHCLAVVAEHPHMQGVIFDQSAVVKVSRDFIVEYEMSDRVTTMAGDYTKDPIGRDYDLILACATLNFVRFNLKPVIEKIYHALKPGGVFVSLSDGVTHERTRPESWVVGSMSWMFSGQDLMFDKGEIAKALKDAGFCFVNSSTVETSMIPMELDIARK